MGVRCRVILAVALGGCGSGSSATVLGEAPTTHVSDSATGGGSDSGVLASDGSEPDPLWGDCKPRHWSVGGDANFPDKDPGRTPTLSIDPGGEPRPLLLPDARILIQGVSFAYRRADDSYDPIIYPDVGVSAQSSLTLLADGNRILLAGGYGVSDAFLIDIPTREWRRTSSLNEPRAYGRTALLPDGKVLVYGGEGNEPSNETRNVAELFDPVSETWAALAGAPRIGSASDWDQITLTALPSGDILITGGRWIGCRSTLIYHWLTKSWEAGPTQATDFTTTTSVTLADGRILIAGGRSCPTDDPSRMGIVADVAVTDGKGPSWKQLRSMNHARTDHHLLALPCGSVLAFGGGGWSTDGRHDPSEGAAVSAIELYDPSRDTWTDLPELPYALQPGAGGVLLPDGRVVITYGTMAPPPGLTGPVFRPLFFDE